MKVIPAQYMCEICLKTYMFREHAEACEKTTPPVYPVGMIFGDHTPGAIYHDITFAIAEIRLDRHYNDSPLWACRDNGAGDSLGAERCGGNYVRLNEHHARLDREHPTFKRMVAYLKSQNIPVTVWDGEKPITLEEATQ